MVASLEILIPPFILWRSAGGAKVEGFDPILEIDCYNKYITYSVINPPPNGGGEPGKLTATERGGGADVRRWAAGADA